MKTKFLFLLLSTLLWVPFIHAQDFFVYNIKGEVMRREGKKMQNLMLNERISPTAVVKIPEGGALILIDSVESKRYKLTDYGTFSVEKLIHKEHTTITNLTKRYLMYLLKQMSVGDKKNWEGNYATVNRDWELDSIRDALSDSIYQKRDSITSE